MPRSEPLEKQAQASLKHKVKNPQSNISEQPWGGAAAVKVVLYLPSS
jgi:hypothetical protein